MGDARNFRFGVLIDSEQCTSAYQIIPKGVCSASCNVFKFCEIADNISERVQNSDVLVMED